MLRILGLTVKPVFTHGERCLARQTYRLSGRTLGSRYLVPECHVRKDGLHTAGGNWIRNRAREIAKMNRLLFVIRRHYVYYF